MVKKEGKIVEKRANLMKTDTTGKITGKIIDVTGKIENDSGKMQFSEDFSGETPDTTEESEISRYRGQRGPDKKPRNFPLHTLKNLPQFRNKSHEEVRQYILETKGIDVGGNFNWNGFAIVIFMDLSFTHIFTKK